MSNSHTSIWPPEVFFIPVLAEWNDESDRAGKMHNLTKELLWRSECSFPFSIF